MEDFLPLLIVAITVIGAVVSAKNKKKQQPTQHTGGENFPFPWLESLGDERREEPQYEMTDGSAVDTADEIVVEEGSQATAVERAVTIQAPAEYDQEERTGIGAEFDVKTAVIYSTILKPKFDDNIF